MSLKITQSLDQSLFKSSTTINGIRMLHSSRRSVFSSILSSWFALTFMWTKFTSKATDTTFTHGKRSYWFRWFIHSATTTFKWFTKVHWAISPSSGTTMTWPSFTPSSSPCSFRDSNSFKSMISSASCSYAFVLPALSSKLSSSWESSKEFHIWLQWSFKSWLISCHSYFSTVFWLYSWHSTMVFLD